MNEDVLAFRQRVLPPDHPDIATSMFSLANCKFNLGDVSGAIVLKQEAVVILERAGYAATPDEDPYN
jgi:hypothetical protein